MNVKKCAIALFVLSSAASLLAAQSSGEKITVSSLLAQNYLIVAAMPAASGGAGLFLRKDTK
jgi:hypothetical protein